MKSLLKNNRAILFEGKNSKKWLKIATLFILVFLAGAAFLYFNYWKEPDVVSAGDLDGGVKEYTGDKGFLFEGQAGEDGAENHSAVTVPAPGSSGPGMFIKVIVSLVVVIILIYLTVRVLKFFYKSRGSVTPAAAAGPKFIEILESKNIAPNKSVHLISVAGKYMVIGSSEKEVNYISPVSPEQYDRFMELKKDICPEENKKRSFKDIFQNYFSGGIN